MSARVLANLTAHSKYGSGLILGVSDLALAALLIVDLNRISRLKLRYWDFAHPSRMIATIDAPMLVDFLVLFLLPLIGAFATNFVFYKLAPQAYHRLSATTALRTRLLITHVLVAFVCVIHFALSEDIRRAAGLCGSAALSKATSRIVTDTDCFNSTFAFLDGFRWPLIVAAAAPVLMMLAKDALYKGGELVSAFEHWRLIGAVGEYQPSYGDEVIYVNSASMAPAIRAVSKTTGLLHDRYQRAVPTSDSARQQLLRHAGDIRRVLYRYLLDDEEAARRWNVEFFPGTSRALEAGILRMASIDHVVLSQYEHPSQVDVVRWLCETQPRRTYTWIKAPSVALFERPWPDQRQAVVDGLVSELAKRPVGRVAVVLSEVHFLTGIHVKVGEIIRQIRAIRDDAVFIVDGSQAVGNLRRPFRDFSGELSGDDFYYFSTHKWLLSPNTCGVVVSEHRAAASATPYDVFGSTLPTATVDPNTIFGLSAALEFLFDRRSLIEKFRPMSEASLAYFTALLEKPVSRLEMCRSSTSEVNASLFVAVRPKLGYRWRYGIGDLWDELRKKNIDLTVIPEAGVLAGAERDGGRESTDYLLRVSFPYFLPGKNIKYLAERLNGMAVSGTS